MFTCDDDVRSFKHPDAQPESSSDNLTEDNLIENRHESPIKLNLISKILTFKKANENSRKHKKRLYRKSIKDNEKHPDNKLTKTILLDIFLLTDINY